MFRRDKHLKEKGKCRLRVSQSEIVNDGLQCIYMIYLMQFYSRVICRTRFSCPVLGAPARVTGFPRLLRGKTTRKGRPGGREGNRGPLTFSTQYRIATWNCGGLSNITMSTCKDLRWNWLRHILRMDERRTVRQVLLNCVKPTQESILGDLNGKDVNRAISLARDRIKALESLLAPLGE